MGYDYFKIVEAMEKVKEYMVEVAEKIKKVFEDNEDLFLKILEMVEDFQEIKNNKIKHKPVLKIKPKKEIMFDKRTNNYYCRNNC